MTINITDGLQHRWPLKNPNFEDTIQGNNLSLQSSGYQIIPGSQGGIFSSTGAYLSGPQDNTYFSPDGFTLSIFFRRDNGNSNKGLIGTFSGNNENSWLLWADGQRSGEISFLIDDENNTRYEIQPNDRYNDGRFHHCVVVIDGSTVKMFVDGDEKGSADISSASFSDPLPNKPINISAYNNDDEDQLDGDFYDARIYDRALSQPERQAIRDYHNRSTTNDLYKGLVGYWPLDSLDVEDYTAYDNHGTVNGNPQEAAGQIGGALDFDGTDDFIDVGNPDVLNIDGNKITLAAWVKTQNNKMSVIGKSHSSTHTPPFYKYVLFIGGTTGDTAVFRLDSTVVNGSINVADNEWHHIAGVYDGSEMRLYVDGVLDNSTPRTRAIETSSRNVRIGCRDTDTLDELFNGLIDDARIYNQALTESDIQRLVNQRKQQVQQL